MAFGLDKGTWPWLMTFDVAKAVAHGPPGSNTPTLGSAPGLVPSLAPGTRIRTPGPGQEAGSQVTGAFPPLVAGLCRSSPYAALNS